MTISIKNEIDAAGTSEFTKADEKADLADTQTPLYIKKVEPKVDTQYGEQTMYHVICEKFGKDEHGQPVTKILAFTHSEYRESKARNIKAAMDAQPGQLAGPAYLGRYQTRNGHNAWELYAEPQQTRSANDQTPTMSPQAISQADRDARENAARHSTPSPGAGTSFDSDIPF